MSKQVAQKPMTLKVQVSEPVQEPRTLKVQVNEPVTPRRAPTGDLIFHGFPDRSYAEKAVHDLRRQFGVIAGVCTSRIRFTWESTNPKKKIEITEKNPELRHLSFLESFHF